MPETARRWPVVLLWAALALLEVHALADAVVAREPGSHLADHVLEALAGTAVLAPAAVAGGRLRRGAVAAISLALVPPALLGLSLAVAGSSARGARADDRTGFVPATGRDRAARRRGRCSSGGRAAETATWWCAGRSRSSAPSPSSTWSRPAC